MSITNSTTAKVTFTDATASSNTTTGAVVVSGGVGIAGNLNVGGNDSNMADLNVTGPLSFTNSLTQSGTSSVLFTGDTTITDNFTVTSPDEISLTITGDGTIHNDIGSQSTFEIFGSTELLTVTQTTSTITTDLVVQGSAAIGPPSGSYSIDSSGESEIIKFIGNYNDNYTSSSGTATQFMLSKINSSTLSATNASVTTTNAYSLYVDDAPSAGSNMTITNPYSLYVNAGKTYLNDELEVNTNSGNVTLTAGNVTLLLRSDFDEVNITTAGFSINATSNISIETDDFLTLKATGADDLTLQCDDIRLRTNSESLTVFRIQNPGTITMGSIGMSMNSSSDVNRIFVSGSFTDNYTAASGTASDFSLFNINDPIIIAANTNVTTTNAYSLYIDGPPIGSTNMTITNPYSFYVNGGRCVLQEHVKIGKGTEYITMNSSADQPLLELESNFNDDYTSASGTSSDFATLNINASTISATNTGVTINNAHTVFIEGPPSEGTNITITNPYSLKVDDGETLLRDLTIDDGCLVINADFSGSGSTDQAAIKMYDSGGDLSIYHTVNDGNGNYNIMLGIDANGQHAVTGDGGAKILLTGHGGNGAISLNASQTGTAGTDTTYNIGIVAESSTPAVRVGDPNNKAGLSGTGVNFLVVESSGTAILTDPGSHAFEVNGTTKLDGNVGINKDSNGTYALDVTGSARKSSGGFSWAVTSDKRLKEDIKDANLDICYDDLKKYKLRRFKWKDDFLKKNKIKDVHVIGFIADEVEKINKKAVEILNNNDLEDCKTLNVDQMIMSLFGAVKKIQEIIETKLNLH